MGTPGDLVAGIGGAGIAIVTHEPDRTRSTGSIVAIVLHRASIPVGAWEPLAVWLHFAEPGGRFTSVFQADFIVFGGTDGHCFSCKNADQLQTTGPLPITRIIVVEGFTVGIDQARHREHGLRHTESVMAMTHDPIRAQSAVPFDGSLQTPFEGLTGI
jgi:hypothetical protein